MTSKRIGYDQRTSQAVRAFWRSRLSASEKQAATGKSDQGNRGAVTAGKTMDSFRDMIADVVRKNAPNRAIMHRNKSLVVLPGYFRATKQWDLLVTHEGRLLAAIELKSLCGPSFGNNANNRCEEALGSGYDFRKAQSESLFGHGAAPFLGYFILVEDAVGSRSSVATPSPHFPADPAFDGASYQTRMKVMCERLLQHQVYHATAVMVAQASPTSGHYHDLSPRTSFRHLLTRLAAHLSLERDCTAETSQVNEAQAQFGLLEFFDDEVFETTE